MQFAVIMRATDSTNLPPQALLALPKETFEMLASRADPRIKAVYPFAGERAGVFIMETDTADELQELIGGLPLSPIVKAEVHPITSVQGVLKTLQQTEQRMSQANPAGTSTRM
jgi:muconolactone delta-isomerase